MPHLPPPAPKPAMGKPSPGQQEALDLDLLRAAASGDQAALARSLDAGANIDATLTEQKPAAALLPRIELRDWLVRGQPTALGVSCFLAASPTLPSVRAANAMRCALLLIERGASLRAASFATLSPLACLCTSKSFEGAPGGLRAKNRRLLCRALALAGADLDAADLSSMTALERAVLAEDAASAKQLAALGAQIDARDALGRTALFRTAGSGSARALPLLLDLEADFDAAADDGRTPLLAALSKRSAGNLSCVRALLRMGCRLTGQELAAAAGARPDPWPLSLSAELARAEAHALKSSVADPSNGSSTAARL